MPWAPDYATDADLKAYLRIGDAVDDAQIALALSAASRAIDRAANRQFGQLGDVEARYYTAFWERKLCRMVVPIDDLMTQVGLLASADLAGDGVYDQAITAPALRPSNAVAKGRPWTYLVVPSTSTVSPTSREDGVEVTARWGWTAVPATIKQACLLQASRFVTRRNAPLGVAGSPELGSEIRLLAKVDPDVEVMIGTYKRWWAVR